MDQDPEHVVQLFSHEQDQPSESLGVLIPRSHRVEKKEPKSLVVASKTRSLSTALVPVVAVALLALVSVSGYGLVVGKNNAASAPLVTVYDPYSATRITLSYGPVAALSEQSFFDETRDAFIDEGLTFVEIDLDEKILRYFKQGVLLKTAPVLSVGESGSWWDAPSGLYTIADKEEKKFSQYTQTYFPNSLIFEGNYLIHGTPQYPDGSIVPEDFVGGGIRLGDEDSKDVFTLAEKGIPVILHQSPPVADDFVYEPTVANLTATHYLVADVENGSILASSDLHEAVPIASLTKLMTAIVASEKISLEHRVRVATPTFVESLIPRLSERSSVSMYSLLQLLLVESSNEAAETIAGEYGREEFVTEMNDKARQLGMFDTTFVDASGIGAQNVASLSDLFKLTRYIHSKKSFIFEITETGEAVGVPGGGEFNALTNFNETKHLDNFVGGKVGETEAAGKTAISLHEIEVQGAKRTVVVIVLGSVERNQDVETLLSAVESRFSR
jgi:hypothetical protein